jgi:hypothetical protein
MIKPDVRLKLGRATTVDGPFALVGTAAELRKLAKALEVVAPQDDEEIEVWLGSNPYGPDEIAGELERLARKIRGDD